MPQPPEVPKQSLPSITTKEKKEEPPQRYAIDRIADAPLIERKIYLAKTTVVFPTREALQQYLSDKKQGISKVVDEYRGNILRNAPAVVGIIREDGRIGGAHIANGSGESLGWIEIEDGRAYEWSTNHIVRMNRTRERPTLFASKEKALQSGESIPMPDNLWDEDIAFPLLEADDKEGLYRIGHPLPRTVQTDVKFPMWVRADWVKHGLLVDKESVELAIRNLQLVKDLWTKLKDDPDARKDVQGRQALAAHQTSIFPLLSGNSPTVPAGIKTDDRNLFQETSDYIHQSGLWVMDDLRKDIGHFAIMDDEHFAHFLEHIAADIDRLKTSMQTSQTYSVSDGKKIKKRIVYSPPQ